MAAHGGYSGFNLHGSNGHYPHAAPQPPVGLEGGEAARMCRVASMQHECVSSRALQSSARARCNRRVLDGCSFSCSDKCCCRPCCAAHLARTPPPTVRADTRVGGGRGSCESNRCLQCAKARTSQLLLPSPAWTQPCCRLLTRRLHPPASAQAPPRALLCMRTLHRSRPPNSLAVPRQLRRRRTAPNCAWYQLPPFICRCALAASGTQRQQIPRPPPHPPPSASAARRADPRVARQAGARHACAW